MSLPIAKQYIKDFEQLGFGVFVHFGLYSLIDRGEWSYVLTHMSKQEYKKLADRFNPGSMEEMVRDISVSGAKYITFTTRHHDGFSLYDTCGLNTYDAPHSAAGRDLVREFVDACRKYDIIPFFYHTTLDWFHPDFESDFDKYLQYLRDSVEILCTRYGKIGGLWFVGNWSKKAPGVWQEDKLYAVIRRHQPDAMIINNTGLGMWGALGHPEIDSVTFERGSATPINREGMEKYVSGEVCDSINMHWGIASNDLNYKSPKTILHALCAARSAGANYLFNVGPDASGKIPAYPKATLEVIGQWMKLFGDAVFCGRPYWYKKDFPAYALRDDKHVYFVYPELRRLGDENVAVFSGGEGELTFEDFDLCVENVRWMDNGQQLLSKKEGNALTIHFTGYPYGYDYCVRIAIADIV